MSICGSITLFLVVKRPQFPVQIQQHVKYETKLAISLCNNQTDLHSLRYVRYQTFTKFQIPNFTYSLVPYLIFDTSLFQNN